MSSQSKDLEKRTVQLSVNIIQKFSKYTRNPELKSACNQIIRSSASIGANYREANNASSPTDFINKIYISKKEAAETEYWLEIFGELLPKEDFSGLSKEVHELLLIFQKIINTMKSKNEK